MHTLRVECPRELARQVLPGMRQRRWGRILNITSIAVKQPVENLMLSNSLRAAVTGFARTLANEIAADGITVNNIPHQGMISVPERGVGYTLPYLLNRDAGGRPLGNTSTVGATGSIQR